MLGKAKHKTRLTPNKSKRPIFCMKVTKANFHFSSRIYIFLLKRNFLTYALMFNSFYFLHNIIVQ